MSDSAVQTIPRRISGSRRSRRHFVPRRLLVREVNWLGDLVISLPALRALRAAFKEAKITVLIRQELAGFFEAVDWIDELLPYSVRPGIRGLSDQWKLVREVRARAFDLAVLFPNSLNAALWPTLAGIPYRAGYSTEARGLLLTHRAAPAHDALSLHQEHYWLGLLRDTLGVAAAIADGERPRLEFSAHRAAEMRQWLDARRRRRSAPLIAIAPAAAYGPAKEWPQIYYAELIDLLARRFGAECVVLGAPSERRKCEQLAASAKVGAIIAAGATTISGLKALLSLCHGFVGNDSGAMHLAAALGIAAVGIFGSTNPRRTGPLGARTAVVYHHVECSPCLRRTCRFGHYQCLRGVGAEEVADALAALGCFVE